VVSLLNELMYTLVLWQTAILVPCKYLGVVRRSGSCTIRPSFNAYL